jgi:hypothetical protein
LIIHAIYQKSRPKNSWHLVSIAGSPELANQEVDLFKKKAIDNGNDQAQVAIQIFNTSFHIPEYIKEIKEDIPVFN